MSKRREIYVLDEEQDGDLCAYLDSLPKGAKSAAVREGLRLLVAHQQGTTASRDVETLKAAIDDLRGELLDAIEQATLANRPTIKEPGAEDPILAARLDAQLNNFFGEGQ